MGRTLERTDEHDRKNNYPDAAAIMQILRAPHLRMGDVAGIDALAAQLIQSPDDPYLQDVFSRVVEEQAAAALLAGDPFFGNPPPPGILPSFGPGRAPILQLPSSDVLSSDLSTPTNMLLLGPTGTGKTTFLKLFLASVLAAAPALVISFDRKRGDIVDAATLARIGLQVVVLTWQELQIAMLQPTPGGQSSTFGNSLVHVLARESHLQASRRLMLRTLNTLYSRRRPPGVWPTFSQWVKTIEDEPSNAASRWGQYRDAALAAMQQVQIELGSVVDYAASDCLDRLLAREGVVVIITEGLSSPIAATLSSIILNYTFRLRQEAHDADRLNPLYFVLDDALMLATGSSANESEGGISPLAEMAFLGRSKRMALIVSSQSFTLLSPALRANCHNVVCFGAYGREAEEIGRHLNLTPEQTARLPFLSRGECVARIPPYPAMLGTYPELP